MATYTKLSNKVIVLPALPANSTAQAIQTALEAEFPISWYYVVGKVFQDGDGTQYVTYAPQGSMNFTAVTAVPPGQDLMVSIDMTNGPWTYEMQGVDFAAWNSQNLYTEVD